MQIIGYCFLLFVDVIIALLGLIVALHFWIGKKSDLASMFVGWAVFMFGIVNSIMILDVFKMVGLF